MSNEFVLDASMTLAWALPDEANTTTDSMLHQVARGSAWVPQLWPYEVANGLMVAQKRGRLTPAQRSSFVEALGRLTIQLEHRPARAILDGDASIALQYSLTAYDAAYLDLALRKGIPLMTQDRALVSAAQLAGVSIAA